jgi:hypothetical protein
LSPKALAYVWTHHIAFLYTHFSVCQILYHTPILEQDAPLRNRLALSLISEADRTYDLRDKEDATTRVDIPPGQLFFHLRHIKQKHREGRSQGQLCAPPQLTRDRVKQAGRTTQPREIFVLLNPSKEQLLLDLKPTTETLSSLSSVYYFGVLPHSSTLLKTSELANQ